MIYTLLTTVCRPVAMQSFASLDPVLKIGRIDFIFGTDNLLQTTVQLKNDLSSAVQEL